jgi:hypothetical protein
MKTRIGTRRVFARLAAVGFCAASMVSSSGAVEGDATKLPLRVRLATASSTFGNFTPAKAVDGVISDASRWVSRKSPAPAWLELDLGGTRKLAGIHLYSGYQDTDPIQAFWLQFWRDGQWRNIPSAVFENNRSVALAIPFDDTVDVTTDRLRLWITASHQDMARVLEVIVWPSAVGNLPPLAAKALKDGKLLQDEPVPLIYLNQSGFNLGKPKRFTAPTLAEGTQFEVRPANGGAAVFSGTITSNIGDFSGFNPTASMSSWPGQIPPCRSASARGGWSV